MIIMENRSGIKSFIERYILFSGKRMYDINVSDNHVVSGNKRKKVNNPKYKIIITMRNFMILRKN